jgi:1,4-alpha-glucan branching enzyme
VITVRFVYLTGIKRALFQNARLVGSWNGWSEIPMASVMGQDGCPAFETKIQFDDGMSGQSVQWGVRLDGPQGANTWGINLEVPDPESQSRTRNFTLPSASAEVLDEYRFTYSRYLGAQKLYAGSVPDLRFTAWAPHAQKVEVVFGKKNDGYISDGGMGIDPDQPVFELIKQAEGVWASAAIPDFDMYTGLPYMFRIVKSGQSKPVMRTDIFSRWQIGRGNQDPAETQWDGDPKSLDGGVSCSVIIDQDLVRTEFEPTSDPPAQISDESFWLTEFTAGNPLPTRVEDLIIYELHVGSLGFGRMDAGNLADAMDLIPYLKDLGVNAVELLPLSESRGTLNWGYGDTHHFVIESSSGGRDKYKHFVRECHRNGIAVIQDVVYNDFDFKAERAEWQYDSDLPEENIYYWYEGRSADYADPTCGYIDNGSSGWAPRYWEEPVRQMFISSAAEFVEEFHVDGFRVDLTQAIHRDNNTQCVCRGIPPILSCGSHSVPNANLYGQKLLREWARTIRMDPADSHAHCGGPLGLVKGHSKYRGRRVGVRCDLVRRFLPRPHRRCQGSGRKSQACERSRLRRGRCIGDESICRFPVAHGTAQDRLRGKSR